MRFSASVPLSLGQDEAAQGRGELPAVAYMLLGGKVSPGPWGPLPPAVSGLQQVFMAHSAPSPVCLALGRGSWFGIRF